jgi:hypothetical protein
MFRFVLVILWSFVPVDLRRVLVRAWKQAREAIEAQLLQPFRPQAAAQRRP